MDIILDEKANIGISTKKPKQLCDDSFPVDFFRREEWKAVLEIEAELATEKTIGHISTSEIFIINTMFDELTTEVEVLFFWVLWHGEFT